LVGLVVLLLKLPPEAAQETPAAGGAALPICVLGADWLERVMLTPEQTVALERLMLAVGLLLTEIVVLVLAVQVPLLTVRLTV
jgi:hypothetical protein